MGKMAVDANDADDVVKKGFDSLYAKCYTKIMPLSRDLFLPSGRPTSDSWLTLRQSSP